MRTRLVAPLIAFSVVSLPLVAAAQAPPQIFIDMGAGIDLTGRTAKPTGTLVTVYPTPRFPSLLHLRPSFVPAVANSGAEAATADTPR